MTRSLTQAPGTGAKTFLDFPLQADFENLEADIAILGIPFGMPYETDSFPNDQSRVPDAIRQASSETDIAPRYDVGNITMVHAERLICNFIGAAVRAGYYEG